MPVDKAREHIRAFLRPVTGIERLHVRAALGRVLAEDVVSPVDVPQHDNSAMDGYAVRSADLLAADFRLPLSGESSAGSIPGTLGAGVCMRIFTGAPIPAGADAVVIQEDVKRDGNTIVFPRTVQPGANIRRRGEDFKSTELLFAPGRRLGAVKLALLATAGVAEVPVFARARVLVVATGDELVAPGQPLAPGQIYESNRLATLAQLADFGVEAIDGGTVRDEPAALRALLTRSTDYDFIITSGGASVGEHDLVKQVFAEIGEIEFWKVRIKPGKPLAFGRVGARTHFFALPGNPVSSLVTYKLFVEPALAVWHHATPHEWKLPATATNGFRRHPGRTEFLRARLYTEHGKLVAEALKGQGSHMLGPVREANAFIRVEADSDGFAAGDAVTVIPWLP
jgi:molybdopterin molybdotransferase